MKIKINKKYFARNRHRELEERGIFNTISRDLLFLTNTSFMIILAPTIVISSVLSHASLLMIANLFLAFGFVFNFGRRVFAREVSISEFLITLIVIALLCLLAFYLSPAITQLSFIGVLCFINIFTTSISSFFLIRNIIIPPIQSLIQRVARFFGFELTEHLFYVSPFSLEKDRGTIDRLSKKFYGYDSFSDKFAEENITPFNNMIAVLSRYVNKYQEPLLGYVNDYVRIKDLESTISKLVTKGDTDSTLTFIKRKIDFKTTKIKALTQVKTELTQESNQNRVFIQRFFNHLPSKIEENTTEVFTQCNALLQSEIERQQTKIDQLNACLPISMP